MSEYKFKVCCDICKKFDICRYDWVTNTFKCIEHGGTLAEKGSG